MSKFTGIFSYSLASATAAEYRTTTGVDEEISFTDGTKALAIGQLLIENCGSAVMYIVPDPSDFRLCIPAGEAISLENVTLRGIKVEGAAGQKLRYSGCFL